jgi:hypothetical protein
MFVPQDFERKKKTQYRAARLNTFQIKKSYLSTNVENLNEDLDDETEIQENELEVALYFLSLSSFSQHRFCIKLIPQTNIRIKKFPIFIKRDKNG